MTTNKAIKQRVQSYITGKAEPDTSILNELQSWSDRHDAKSIASRALSISNRCRRTGHVVLADKIDAKYKRFYPKSDLVMALGYSLSAAKRTQK